ncbi:MAG: hypothetical protein ISS78_04655 [Phycisphaerae bacterium]|nr:hypothetical protein [Phycisphaerae bacterium]
MIETQGQAATPPSPWWQYKWLVALLAFLAACGVSAIIFLLVTRPTVTGPRVTRPTVLTSSDAEGDLSSASMEDLKEALRWSQEAHKKAMAKLQRIKELEERNLVGIKLRMPDDKTLRGWLAIRPVHKTQAAALANVSGCRILVEDVHEGSPISQAELREAVELQFRKAGVEILSDSTSDGRLSLNVDILPTEKPPHFVYNVDLYFDDRCINFRTLNQLPGIMWRVSFTGIVPEDVGKKQIKDVVAKAVDKFLNDYLKTNPK